MNSRNGIQNTRKIFSCFFSKCNNVVERNVRPNFLEILFCDNMKKIRQYFHRYFYNESFLFVYRELREALWSALALFGAHGNSGDLHGDLWSSTKLGEALWSSMEQHVALRSSVEFDRASWNSMELCGPMWSAVDTGRPPACSRSPGGRQTAGKLWPAADDLL